MRSHWQQWIVFEIVSYGCLWCGLFSICSGWAIFFSLYTLLSAIANCWQRFMSLCWIWYKKIYKYTSHKHLRLGSPSSFAHTTPCSQENGAEKTERDQKAFMYFELQKIASERERKTEKKIFWYVQFDIHLYYFYYILYHYGYCLLNVLETAKKTKQNHFFPIENKTKIMVNMVHTYTVHMAAEWRKKVKINSIPLNNPHPQLHQQRRTQKKT